MMRFFLSFCVLLGILQSALASHNRAGEITYKYLGPQEYEITVITYTRFTNPPSESNNADRCEIEINFGDGSSAIVQRTNGDSSLICPRSGVMVAPDIKRNEYVTTHRFPGQYNYNITVEDPNRNGGIENIDKSISIPFSIKTTLNTEEINNSPDLKSPPIDEGCVGAIYTHNPEAVDLDDDSLSFSLQICLGSKGEPIPGYVYPNEIIPGQNNQLSIDPKTGTVTWDSPQKQGEYNICIRVDEYRRGNLIGSVLRDMQITIGVCDNTPPEVADLSEICITAGDFIDFPITATDADGDLITLTANGLPFVLNNSPANFNNNIPVQGNSPLQHNVTWQTNCSHVKKEPYTLFFKARDHNAEVNLVDFEELLVKVIAPAPTNPDANAKGNSIELSWDASICTNASGYKIYRKTDSIGFLPDQCVTGVPLSTGYTKIATIGSPQTTSFIDDNNGTGLIHGQMYCYMIIAYFPDGSESYATLEFCEELIKDVPVITRVSVNTTDQQNGSDTISWAKPTEFPSGKSAPPYFYRVYRAQENGFAAAVQIGTTATSNDLETTDTTFVDSGLNTEEEQYFYYVELISGVDQTSAGRSHMASSVFLSSIPSDNKLALSWNEDVPWTNSEYVIYKFSNNPNSIDSAYVLDTVSEPSYIDSNLTNLVSYRYFVKSVGRYSSPGFIDPILNNSQIHTGTPVDLEPPCPPAIPYIESDCRIGETFIRWGNPENHCNNIDDVVAYNIYYTPVVGEPFRLYEAILDKNDTSKLYSDLFESVAGCYAITAIDSFQNESDFSEALCVDNCPIYELPNVFTPGGDGVNDYFIPFPYRHVESINLEIFNRWGVKVFGTTDPNIKWDGRDENNNFLKNGVYYYTCTINEIRLTGIVPRVITGYIHILNQQEYSPSGN